MNRILVLRAAMLASLFLLSNEQARSAIITGSVNVTTSNDWFVSDQDGTSGYEINDGTSNMLRAALRPSRKGMAFLWMTTYYANIPASARITSASLHVFPWSISYSSPNTTSDIEIVGLQPVFGSPHLLPHLSGPTLGGASFKTTGNMTEIPLDKSFFQDNEDDDKLFVLRIQMANSGTDISMSSSRHSSSATRPYLELSYVIPEPATGVLMVAAASVLGMRRVGRKR